MAETHFLHLSLPTSICPSPIAETGFAISDQGELLICTGTTASRVQLTAPQWAWFAKMAGSLADALKIDSENAITSAVARPTHHGVGHA
jgi:hypothetical protein